MNGARFTLTATERLARELREQANLERSRAGAAVWEAPHIASLARWITDIWTAGWPDAQLLSGTQELVLWLDAIQNDKLALLAPLAAAREARRADQIARRHRIAIEDGPAWLDEHRAFRRWRRSVERRLHTNRWLTAADLPGEVARLIADAAIAVPESIVLAGFVDPPMPAEQAVLDALAARGTRIETAQTKTRPARVWRWRLPDPDAQWRRVAQDIRERLRAQAENPPRIVIALPDAQSPRTLAESVLRDLLAPWVARGEGAAPWRWERGQPLSEQPVVDAMLAVLELETLANPPERISRVLLATGLWTESERAATAAADEQLRRRGGPRLRLAAVREALSSAPALAARFAAFEQARAQGSRSALPSTWAARFREWLELLGWPGGEALDSPTYQAVRAARGLLDRLGTLDAQLGRVAPAVARQWLSELARGSPHAARVEHTQPVLITTLDEAASLRCDLLYLLDATTAQWPATSRPTPFLPLEVQRAAGVAEASSPAWLVRAQARVERLLEGCAPEVIVCSPQFDARGAELQASSLFGAPDAWEELRADDSIGALECALGEHAAFTWPESDPVPPVNAEEQAGLRADSALFKAWFESPFFAFAIRRLGIEPLPMPPRGLDARVQGTLLHEVLHQLWGELGDSHALSQMDEAALAARIASCVEQAAARLLPVAEYGPALRALEQARARDLVSQWLQHERRRLDPFRVVEREVATRPVVAGLSLSLRLDRVDCVDTPYGPRWLVIDYKTGREADPRGWKAEAPTEPQLPLYASHAATAALGVPQVDGICFAHLKDGHPALVAHTGWRKKLIEDPATPTRVEWDDSLGGWRIAIELAAQGFLAGEAWHDERVGRRSPNAALLALTGRSPDAGDDIASGSEDA